MKNTILITGAGGTIGSELAKRLSDHELVLLDNCEYNLYRINREVNAHSILGDIRNTCLLNKIFDQYHPQIVYHAAAVKHVAIAEKNIAEAARVNIFGTKAIADICKCRGVKMVMISTDKAVKPVSIMGITKAVAEAYCLSLDFDCTIPRFVNVSYSSGSVLPLFKEQIAQGVPVTITHPDITRYFVTKEEAINFILDHAGKKGIFALKGQLMKIEDIAKEMIAQSGKSIPIEYIGLQPGERMHEIIDDSPTKINLALLDDLMTFSNQYNNEATMNCLEGML